MGDFSVVLFRPNFMLASEGHSMKVLCSQEVVSSHRWGSSPIRALRRHLPPRHHGMCPSAWLRKRD